MARVVYVVLVILVLGYLGWPYASLYGLFVDLKTADVKGVDGRVDWLAVRAGLADDVEQFAKIAANKALNSDNELPNRTKILLAWDSLPVADEIAGVFATPQGLIALYRSPKVMGCALKAIKSASVKNVSDCLKQQRTMPKPETQPHNFEGPNFSRILEKFDFAFFTGLFSFRFAVLHHSFPVTLDFSRKAEGWLLVRVSIPLEMVLSEIPVGGN